MKGNRPAWMGKRTLRVVLSVSVMLVLMISLGYFMLRESIQRSWDRVDSLHTLDQDVSTLESDIVAEEAAQRGYDLTGLEEYLVPFHRAERDYSETAQRLRSESTLSPQGHQLLLQMIRQGEAWHDEFGVPQVSMRRTGHLVSAQALHDGKTAMDNFTNTCGRLKTDIVNEKSAEQRLLLHRVEWTFAVFVGCLLLLGLYAVVAVGGDLSKRRRTEQILRSTQSKLTHAQRIAHIGSWEWDPIRNVRVWSEEMYAIFGVTPESFRGTQSDVLRFIHPDDRSRFLKHIDSVLKGNRYDLEYRIVRPSGEVRIVHGQGEPIMRDGLPERIAGIVQDVTDRKHTEELLLKSEKLSTVGQMAAGVAHEIRNPLTALKGFLQLMPTAEEDTERRYVEIMREEIRRIETIVSELLVLAKPQAIQFKTEDVRASLQDVITLLNTQAILCNVRIDADFAQDIPPIQCEPNQLKQVFVNLIQNAIEAMPDGGHLDVRMVRDEAGVKIQFADTGTGIEPDRLTKLGEPFYTTKEKGTGLGLMVTQKIIQNHHGTLTIESQPGQGTTVSIVLPA